MAQSASITIPVHGMTCAACESRVQRALQRVEGVEVASVNLMMANAAVRYDPTATSPDLLVAAIRDTGYDGTVSIELEYSPDPDKIVEWTQRAYDGTAEIMREIGVRA